MKYFLYMTLLAASPWHPYNARAQSTADLITQLLLDAEKLSTLKSTLDEMVQAYQVIDKGYTQIRDIVKGNFNLHKAFLDALLAVSPNVQSYPRIQDILREAGSMASEFKVVSRRLGGGPFTLEEIDFIIGIYNAFLQRCNQSLDELTLVLTDGDLRMSDDQRMQTIDRIHADLNSQLSLFRSFSNEVSIQGAQRVKELNDVNTLRWMYGLPN